MNPENSNLSELRREIDDIDNALHDLLMRRASVVERVKDLKQTDGGVIFRPGREAEILRRLAGRHAGSLSRNVVVRIWRELMSAFVSLQGPFVVSVWDSGDIGCWDIARDHFGTETTMTRHKSADAVLNAIAEGSATVGVLPLPQDCEANPWWPALTTGHDKHLKICARVPFASRGNSRGIRSGALIVSQAAPEKSGNDRSILLVECDDSTSLGRLTNGLTSANFDIISVAGRSSTDAGANQPVFLVEVSGFAAPDDDRLASFVENLTGIVSADFIGGYAVPLDGAF
ncbi:chorismate mutase [Alphaproteobacteria bacterium]|nr:chorismate mutase [Alphaproteobacteria bacterium]